NISASHALYLKIMKKAFILLLAFSIVEISFAQTVRDRIKERKQQTNSDRSVAPDYSDLYYWAAHPSKWDPSDSIPNFLKDNGCDTSVDVFFLHPTTYIKGLVNASINADINDPAINALTDKEMLMQASVFNANCRVFTPRYRQAHLKAYFQYKSPRSKKAFDLAYEDLRAAFQYYLDHWNKGRPIIIASHSQGSMHA